MEYTSFYKDDKTIKALCSLLDEHHIEWCIDYDLHSVEWINGNTVLVALPMYDGSVAVQATNKMTIEQAVKATLG